MELNDNTSFTRQSKFLRRRSALILNADYRPLSYLPLSVWPWKEAIKAKFLDRVDVIAEYDDQVNSPSVSIKIPSVVVLRDYVKPSKSTAFTRFNLFLRDEFSCQYCGKRGEMTFDHVVPRCRGGKTTWKNVVAACGACNLRKGSRDLKSVGMKVRQIPIKPSVEILMNKGRKFPPNYLHKSWMDFLYWDAELET
jgi:5-methylcytosine-specific restriction endonuclease McrA